MAEPTGLGMTRAGEGVLWVLTCLQCLAGHAPPPHHLGKPQVSINQALGHVGKCWAT